MRGAMLNRRTAIQSLGAAAAALALPPVALAARASVRKAPRLRVGDAVGLIEPAGFSDDEYDLALVEETVRAMGLVPKVAPHVLERHGYLAGTDEARAGDINAMYADKGVRALFAVRGGWGCARLLPYLDWATIRANPKLLVGFSDVTALHLAFADRAGFATIHGPNAANSWGAASWDAFRALAFDGATPTYRNPETNDDRLVQTRWRTFAIWPGQARGRLLGGNLSVLAAMVGTPWLPDFDGAILFLEDVAEAPYRIDRMLTQLGQSGLLGRVAGVVFGQCSRCVPVGAAYGGFTVAQVLKHHLEPLGVPAFQGAMIGHIADQFSIPVGVEAEIDAEAGTIRILERAVA